MGKTPPRKENEYWDNATFPWVSIADLIPDSILYETKEKVNKYSAEKVFKNRISAAGTLLMSFKLTVGKVSILGIDAFHNEAIISIYPFIDIDKIMTNYLFFIMPLISLSGDTKTAIKGNTLNTDSLNALYIPLPPIEEQRRIVEKINILMPLINEYDELEKSITKLNKEFPHNIKKSVLQYAIEGKLTEQNKNDEPAEKLLKRIKEEKEKLIKEGRIKKEKTTSEIYKKDGSYYERVLDGKNIVKDVCIDDELPFDIPDSWVWCNVSDIANIYTGNSINENEKKTKYMGISSGYCYIATKDVGFDNIINYDNGVKIPNLDNKFRIAPKNSILLCIEGGSAGKKISVTDRDVCFGNKLCCFDTVSVNVFFMYYYLQSPLFNSIFKENINGIIGGVSINKLKQLKIPLPPIEEQNRIVRKIKKFNEIINTIK